jgi:DNA-binding MarR family transcriptional regulator
MGTRFEIPVGTEIERALTVLFRPARIKRAQEILSRKAGIDLEQSGYIALVCLEQSGPMRLSDLAEAAGVDVSTMSRLADRLVAGGLLETGDVSTDRRVLGLQLSDQGLEAVRTIRRVRQEALLRALDDWSEEDQVHLAQLLDRFADSLERFVRNDLTI